MRFMGMTGQSVDCFARSKRSATLHIKGKIMRDIHAVPAYGRDYRSAAAVKADWTEGKDFRDALTGQYLSIRDNVPGQVWVRYARMTKLVRVQ
jgi:hypothetical protein